MLTNCFSRWDIREKEEMKQFFEFIYNENEIGNISRQELVSMVPVLLLVSSLYTKDCSLMRPKFLILRFLIINVKWPCIIVTNHLNT